jgi:hypothetical protein
MYTHHHHHHYHTTIITTTTTTPTTPTTTHLSVQDELQVVPDRRRHLLLVAPHALHAAR